MIPLFPSPFIARSGLSLFSFRVLSWCPLVFRFVLFFRSSCFVVRECSAEWRIVFVLVLVFALLLSSFEVTFFGQFVDLRICSVSFSFIALHSTMPENVDRGSPIAASYAGTDTSNAAPPGASVTSVPLRFMFRSLAGPVRLVLKSPRIRRQRPA